MERNTLLAVALSVLVLFLYQAIFVPPKQTELLKNPQPIAIQSFNTIKNPSEIISLKNNEKTTNTQKNVLNYDIINNNIDISYINMGGSLHKINFSGNNPLPITDVLSINGFDSTPYSGQKLDNKTVLLEYEDKNWQITKIYKVHDQNSIKARMEIKNLSKISILDNFLIKIFKIDESGADFEQNSRENSLYEYSVYARNQIFRKDNANKFDEKNYKKELAKVEWVGFRNRYYAFIVKPKFETMEYEIKAENSKQLDVFIKPEEKNLAPGESVIYDFDIYAGPQDPWLMEKYGGNFEKIIVFSKYFVYEWPAKIIYYAIPFFHNIFRTWGIAIILISAMIYGLTYPLTMKSMISMRKMQEIQPKIAALRERYKNDPQKLNAEMIEIYRREKINPFSGCLPVLLQMPFFYALYQILWRAQYLQGKGFLWIKDLSQPDRLMILPFSLPFLGNELNILPILTGCIMFLQQKISSKNMVAIDEQQAMQQKMMMYFFPVFMIVIFYRFASSWALYFLVFYILSTATQWKIARYKK